MAKKKDTKSNSIQSFFNTHKNLRWLLPIFVIVLLSFLVLCKMQGDKIKYAEKSMTTNNLDNTTGWKEYTNQENTYSFKYPSSWTIDSSNPNRLTTTREGKQKVNEKSNTHLASLDVQITDASFEESVAEVVGADTKDAILLDNMPGIKLEGKTGVANSVKFVTVIANKNDTTYIISFSTQSKEFFPVFTSEFEQILSTFKFTN